LIPFDIETYKNNPEQLVVGTTDCETGEAVYYGKENYGDQLVNILRASSSLPFVAPSVEFNDRLLLDGGIVDPIPIKKAQNDGYQKNVIILTKPAGYSKRPSKWSSYLKYKQHPKINDLLVNRHKLYNETLAYIKTEEEKGNVLVIRPSVSMPVGRIERNRIKLENLYELGWNDAKNQIEHIKKFISYSLAESLENT
jgi:predicted patatin/cPLA2 family phospholipase